MRAISTSVGPLATPVSGSVANGQNVSAAGPININGSAASNGVAILSPPARVAIFCGDISNPVYRVEGRDVNWRMFGETLIGIANPVLTVNRFWTVTNIYVNRALSSALVVGNDNGGASDVIRLDEWADAPLGCQVVVSGTANFTVQHSFDDPNDLVNPTSFQNMFWDTSLLPPGAVAASQSLSFGIPTAPLWMRILLNSGTGSVRMTCTQYNVVEV